MGRGDSKEHKYIGKDGGRYQYKDDRPRPERNGRRFFPVEKNEETIALVAAAKAIVAQGLGKSEAEITDAETFRAVLRHFVSRR